MYVRVCVCAHKNHTSHMMPWAWAELESKIFLATLPATLPAPGTPSGYDMTFTACHGKIHHAIFERC